MIYSETTPNTPVDPTIDVWPTNCYNCENDCQGIILDVLREEDPFEKTLNLQYLIHTTLTSKGYYEVNLELIQFRGKPTEALKLTHYQAVRFANNMMKLGYPCRVLPAEKPRWKYVVIKGHSPEDLLNVYHFLDVIE